MSIKVIKFDTSKLSIMRHFRLCFWLKLVKTHEYAKKYWQILADLRWNNKAHNVHGMKTYIIKIQSRNLTHDHRLLAVQKVSFQMILKNKIEHDPS